MKQRSGLVVLAACAIALAGCAAVQTTQGGAVGVERKQTMLVSQEEINKAAVTAYRNELAQARQKGALNQDAAQVERVRVIARRLIPATGAFRADAPQWNWEVNIISAKQLNAWCMPGGKIVIYSGLIDRLHLTDDEIAAIMGHEMAHALREHARERASQQMVTGAAIGIGAAVLGVGRSGADLANMVANITLTLPNSRLHETEADRIGVELAARAGYDPRAALSLWEKMRNADGGQPPEWLSTHPTHENRMAELRADINRVMPLYQRARTGG